MPIVIPKDIPAYSVLQKENIFVMTDKRAFSQDIRPIEIGILNLMPTKIETETQLLRLLSNSPLQVNLTLLSPATHKSKNVSALHMEKFYKNFDEVKDDYFDGLIITGAPVETLSFEEVDYWEEMKQIMEFSKTHVTSTMYICWGAQAGLYYHFGINKQPLAEKMFGVFPHVKQAEFDPLLKGFDDVFYIPQSRHTGVNADDIFDCKELEVLGFSEEAGCSIVRSKDNRMIFLSGHSEYDRDTLKNEYYRDLQKGLPIKPPKNYFSDETQTEVDMKWSGAANLLFANWLNYYLYQVTPYEFANKKKK